MHGSSGEQLEVYAKNFKLIATSYVKHEICQDTAYTCITSEEASLSHGKL